MVAGLVGLPLKVKQSHVILYFADQCKWMPALVATLATDLEVIVDREEKSDCGKVQAVWSKVEACIEDFTEKLFFQAMG